MIEIISGRQRAPSPFPFGILASLQHLTLAPEEGERTHHHRNVEVLTWVRAGEMTARDARETTHVIRTGGLHRLSAGTGVTHAEYNLGDTPARYLQIVVEAEIKGIPPGYQDSQLPELLPPAEWVPLVTGDEEIPAGMSWNADATVYLLSLAADATTPWRAPAGRTAFWQLLQGEITLGEARLEEGDGARMRRPINLLIEGLSAALLIYIDLPASL